MEVFSLLAPDDAELGLWIIFAVVQYPRVLIGKIKRQHRSSTVAKQPRNGTAGRATGSRLCYVDPNSERAQYLHPEIIQG